MKLLIAGADGQLGRALQAVANDAIALSRAQLDITDAAAVQARVAAARPDVIVNAAAYTAVDRAESAVDAAFAVNATGAANLAGAAQATGARLVQLSTDFVFDGLSGRPYAADAHPNPTSVYGRSKLQGEQLVQQHCPAALIVRTAWVYAAQGQNFLRTMLRLMHERAEIRVVADQIGTPTHAASLARAILQLVQADARGIWHWTDAGVASWYDFATAIAEEAAAIGLIAAPVAVVPIATKDYPTPARRPPMSVLDKQPSWARIGPARHWRAELRLALRELRATDAGAAHGGN